MANIKLYTKCPQCAGIGIRIVYGDGLSNPPTEEVPCIACDETGYIEEIELDGVLLGDMSDRIDDALNKLSDIWEKLNE